MGLISEYDAFGPWVYEIDEDHEIPKLFRNYYNEHDKPIILIKIPRDIERRDATPDMDLYDFLIGAYDKYLCILKRDGSNVVESRIYYNDIITVKDVHALIRGELIFSTEYETIQVNYNTISEDIIFKLLNIIGQKYTSSNIPGIELSSIPVEYDPDSGDSLDFLFLKLINTIIEINPSAHFIAYQPRIYIKGSSPELSKDLSKIAFIIAKNELIILKRETPAKKNEKEDLYYSILHIPLRSIKGISITGFDKANLLYETQLSVGSQTFTYIVENRNKRIFELYKKLNVNNQGSPKSGSF